MGYAVHTQYLSSDNTLMEPTIFSESDMTNSFRKMQVWPEDNYYMTKGILEKIIPLHASSLSENVTFIDFSRYHLRKLIHPSWIYKFAGDNTSIILLTDDTMVPLAKYWYERHATIIGIINSQKSDTLIMRNKTSYISKKYNNTSSLTEIEFIFLAHILQGRSIRTLAESKKLNSHQLSYYKKSVENKMGCSVNRILGSAL